MKEFKVGDRCYIELTIKEIRKDSLYPIIAQMDDVINVKILFTSDGKYNKNSIKPILKHIEDITPKPELPKWMMVSDDGKEWNKRFVVYKDSHAVVTCYSGEISTMTGVVRWKYAKEIESENTKLQELEIKYKELGEEIEKLKK